MTYRPQRPVLSPRWDIRDQNRFCPAVPPLRMQDINTIEAHHDHELSTADRLFIAGLPHCPSLVDDEAAGSALLVRARHRSSNPVLSLPSLLSI